MRNNSFPHKMLSSGYWDFLCHAFHVSRLKPVLDKFLFIKMFCTDYHFLLKMFAMTDECIIKYI